MQAMEVDADRPAASTGEAETSSEADIFYAFDEAKLEEVRSNKLWMQDPKYFKKVMISPSATMKMMMHANSGVEKGMKSGGGKPVEVMGLMLGRPDTRQPRALVVTDVFPLPVEGAETKVLADDAEVINYMISLGEALELTRKEKFMGWYHSHPFDVEVHSHCFLSSTDVSTQLQWQRAEDPHGNPWLAVVIDPLRSLAKGKPEFGAFRVYPPEYAAPRDECPDGRLVREDARRVEQWASCWNRYYRLEIEYFLSALAADVMGCLAENFLWMRTLASAPAAQEREARERFSERVGAVSDRLAAYGAALGTPGAAAAALGHRGGGALARGGGAAAAAGDGGAGGGHKAGGAGGGGGGGGGGAAGGAGAAREEGGALGKGARGACELAIEHVQGQATQVIKDAIFSFGGTAGAEEVMNNSS